MARSIAWQLVAPAYVTGGIVTVASGLFSQLPAKWAQLQAAGGTFGLTVWLLLLPLGIPEPPAPAQHPFIVPRSAGWIVAGAVSALIFIGVLGPGILGKFLCGRGQAYDSAIGDFRSDSVTH